MLSTHTTAPALGLKEINSAKERWAAAVGMNSQAAYDTIMYAIDCSYGLSALGPQYRICSNIADVQEERLSTALELGIAERS